MGIIPLYIGWDQHGTFMASELKALKDTVQKYNCFLLTLYDK
jgi:asparagine synthase (glutamine-hydrolysing)